MEVSPISLSKKKKKTADASDSVGHSEVHIDAVTGTGDNAQEPSSNVDQLSSAPNKVEYTDELNKPGSPNSGDVQKVGFEKDSEAESKNHALSFETDVNQAESVQTNESDDDLNDTASVGNDDLVEREDVSSVDIVDNNNDKGEEENHEEEHEEDDDDYDPESLDDLVTAKSKSVTPIVKTVRFKEGREEIEPSPNGSEEDIRLGNDDNDDEEEEEEDDDDSNEDKYEGGEDNKSILSSSPEIVASSNAPPSSSEQSGQSREMQMIKDLYDTVLLAETEKNPNFGSLSPFEQSQILLKEMEIKCAELQDSFNNYDQVYSYNKPSSNIRNSIPLIPVNEFCRRPNITISPTREEESEYKEFIERENRFTRLQDWDDYPDKLRLFVGNLPANTISKRDLFRIFNKYGEVEQVLIKGGYGFVQFKTADACADCVKGESNVPLHNKYLRFDPSKPLKPKAAIHRDTNNASIALDGRGREREAQQQQQQQQQHENEKESAAQKVDDPEKGDIEIEEEEEEEDDDDETSTRKKQKLNRDCIIVITDKSSISFVRRVQKAIANARVTFDLEDVAQQDLSDVLSEAAYSGVLGVCVVKENKVDVQTYEENDEGEIKFDEYADIEPEEASEVLKAAKHQRYGDNLPAYEFADSKQLNTAQKDRNEDQRNNQAHFGRKHQMDRQQKHSRGDRNHGSGFKQNHNQDWKQNHDQFLQYSNPQQQYPLFSSVPSVSGVAVGPNSMYASSVSAMPAQNMQPLLAFQFGSPQIAPSFNQFGSQPHTQPDSNNLMQMLQGLNPSQVQSMISILQQQNPQQTTSFIAPQQQPAQPQTYSQPITQSAHRPMQPMQPMQPQPQPYSQSTTQPVQLQPYGQSPPQPQPYGQVPKINYNEGGHTGRRGDSRGGRRPSGPKRQNHRRNNYGGTLNGQLPYGNVPPPSYGGIGGSNSAGYQHPRKQQEEFLKQQKQKQNQQQQQQLQQQQQSPQDQANALLSHLQQGLNPYSQQ